MPKSFGDILSSLRSSRDGYLPSAQIFPPLDVDALARELRLEERAEAAGRADLPPATATDPDSTEFAIVAEIANRERKAREAYEAQLALYDQRIRNATLSRAYLIDIDAAGKNTLTDFRAANVNHGNHLHTLREEVRGRDEEFEAFRRKHQLQRPPRVPTPARTNLTILALVFFGLSEAVLNGSFFAEGSEAGLIGGVLTAILFSAVNVSSAAAYGFLALPMLFHRLRSVKLAGLVALTLFALFSFGLNLTIGHYRDLFALGQGTVPMPDLVEGLMTSPFMFRDTKSALLVLIGLGLALGTVLDVVVYRDVYPGYASVGHRRDDAFQRYANRQSTYLDELKQRRDYAISDMTGAIQKIHDSQYDLNLATKGRSILHEAFRAHLHNLARSQQHLVQRYREINVTHRSQEPPAFFSAAMPENRFFDAGTLPPPPDLAEDVSDRAIERIELYIAEINRLFEEVLPQYQTSLQLRHSTLTTDAAA